MERVIVGVSSDGMRRESRLSHPKPSRRVATQSVLSRILRSDSMVGAPDFRRIPKTVHVFGFHLTREPRRL